MPPGANCSTAYETLCPMSAGNSTWLALVTLNGASLGAPHKACLSPLKVKKSASGVTPSGTMKSDVISGSPACVPRRVASTMARITHALEAMFSWCLVLLLDAWLRSKEGYK